MQILDFFADWCSPCKALAPVLDELEKEYPDIEFQRVNVDGDPLLAKKYSVQSIPTLVFLKDGQEINRTVGSVSKTTIEDIIKADS